MERRADLTKFELRVLESFGALIAEKGLRKRFSSFDELRFGNAILEYEAQHMAIRFVSDRDDLLVYLARSGPSPEWIPLHTLLGLIGYARNSLDYSADSGVAVVLSKEYDKLARMITA